MQITDVRIRIMSIDSKLKAVASVTFDNELAVHDIKIIDGINGLFIAMPSRKTKDGEFKDITHPISSEMRQRLEAAIYDEYNKVKAEQPKSIETNEPIA